VLSDLAHVMPVTARIVEKLEDSEFKNVMVVHINHLLDDLLKLNEIFLHLGAELVFIPKIYGRRELPSNLPYESFYPRMTDAGFSIYKDFECIESAADHLEFPMELAITRAFVDRVSTSNKRVLIVEDGGYYYRVFPTIESRRLCPPGVIAVVEQTTRGLAMASKYFLRSGKLGHPVLSVARSKVKTRYENRFIAQRVIEELAFLLYQRNDFLSYRDVLVIGYGILGRAIAMALRNMNCHVLVVDTDPEVERAAIQEGFEVARPLSPQIFETLPIVLGATGDVSFTLSMFEQFLLSSASRLYLVSASSERVEFSPVIRVFERTPEERRLLAKALQFLHPIEDISVQWTPVGCIYSFSYRGNTREVVLLAEGYPVNLYRSESQSLPSRVFDPVCAELLLLCEYALTHSSSLNRNTVHLLGRDPMPGLLVDEEEIMKLWMEENYVPNPEPEVSMWQMFDPHPCELRLCSRWRE
jgi:hypothetical protein